MSDSSASAFGARTVIILVIAGIAGFAAFLLLAAYAPDLRSGRDGRAHGLSTSAIGFRAIHDLLDATGAETDYVRDENLLAYDGLTIVTLEYPYDEERLQRLIDNGAPLLIVLPKWGTVPVPMERDRVFSLGPTLGNNVYLPETLGPMETRISDTAEGTILQTGIPTGTPFRAPDSLQTIAGKNIISLMETPSDEIVLANVVNSNIHILADPDLLNNRILADKDRARAALVLLNDLNADGGTYRFDLVTNGFAGSSNLLTLAFEPPFLALTLCILAAALMAGLQAAFRFGPALHEPRAIAFGKRALVDNSAELLRLARREHLSSERYADLTREAAVEAIGNPRELKGEELDQWLDGFDAGDSPSFTQLSTQARQAHSRQDILNAARALHQWRKAVTE